MALNEGDLWVFVIVAIAVSRGHEIVIWAFGNLVSNRRSQRPGVLQLPLADFIAAFRQASHWGSLQEVRKGNHVSTGCCNQMGLI